MRAELGLVVIRVVVLAGVRGKVSSGLLLCSGVGWVGVGVRTRVMNMNDAGIPTRPNFGARLAGV